VLREMFWPRKEDVTGEWTKLLTEELYGMYPSLNNFIRVVKSGRMG